MRVRVPIYWNSLHIAVDNRTMQWHLYNTLTSKRTFNFKCYLFVNDCFKLHKSNEILQQSKEREPTDFFNDRSRSKAIFWGISVRMIAKVVRIVQDGFEFRCRKYSAVFIKIVDYKSSPSQDCWRCGCYHWQWWFNGFSLWNRISCITINTIKSDA